MSTSVRRRRGTRGALATGLATVTLLTACAGDEGSDAAAPTSSASESSAEKTSAPDLASGLLPAEAFGPEAAVVSMTIDQLRQGAGMAAAGAEGMQITPEACAPAVQGTQPSFDDFEDVVAQTATAGSAATVEILVRGGPIKGAVDQLAAAAERCPQAQLTSPQIGQATITFESLPVDELGDGSAMVRYTTAVPMPDGTQTSVPVLIGAVQDGDRLLMLISVDGGGAVPGAPAPAPQDPVAFADLLTQAHETQADALD